MAVTPFVFKPFTPDAIGRNRRELVTAPLWSGNSTALYTAFTSSDQSDGSKRYYYEVYNSQSMFPNAEIQFSVTYGDTKGSGSSTGSYGIQDYDYPTQAIYSQYKQMLLPTGVSVFEFTNGTTSETSEYIYVVNVKGELFIKKIVFKDGLYLLRSLNQSYKDIKVKDFNVIGKVKGVLNRV